MSGSGPVSVRTLGAAIALSMALAGCDGGSASEATFKPPHEALAAADGTAHLYRSATCACCVEHAAYLTAEGFEVVEHVVDDVMEVKRDLGVPEAFDRGRELGPVN